MKRRKFLETGFGGMVGAFLFAGPGPAKGEFKTSSMPGDLVAGRGPEAALLDHVTMEDWYQLVAQNKNVYVLLDGIFTGCVQEAHGGPDGWIKAVVLKRLNRRWFDEYGRAHEEWVNAIHGDIQAYWFGSAFETGDFLTTVDPKTGEVQSVDIRGDVQLPIVEFGLSWKTIDDVPRNVRLYREFLTGDKS